MCRFWVAETSTVLKPAPTRSTASASGCSQRKAPTGALQPRLVFWRRTRIPGSWGLILRSSSEWLGNSGGDAARWRAFKPAEQAKRVKILPPCQ